MHTTYEVTVRPTHYASLTEMIAWCEANATEFDSSPNHEEDTYPALFEVHNVGFDAGRWDSGMEHHFYFFNEIDAIHFKLTFAESL